MMRRRNWWGLFLLFMGGTWGAMALSALTGDARVLAAPAAITWYVDVATGNDGNNCRSPGTACATIAAAVDKAADGDTIEIAAGTYPEHDIEITKALTLNGAGNTIVDAGAQGRAFYVTASPVMIAGVQVQNGLADGPEDLFTDVGGAMLIGSVAFLTLQNVTLVDNQARVAGGGIYNLGALVLENTQVLSNTTAGDGGGLYNANQGVITITHSLLAHNTADGFFGGGIYAGGQSVRIEDTTVAGNRTGSYGGGLAVFTNDALILDRVTLSGNHADSGAGLYAQLGAITATNITVSGNNATRNFSGIYLVGANSSLSLQNSTIAHNTRTSTAGTGVNGVNAANGAVATLVNTILDDNQDNNCSRFSPPTSLGYNLSSDGSCGLNQSGDQPSTDPRLGPLADNGGWAPTHSLLPGSPAIDGGDNAQCPSLDARGVARPYDGNGDGSALCDVGAVEARHQVSIADTAIREGNAGTATAVFTVTLAPASTQTVQVSYATADGTALAGVDYAPAAGVLTFNPGETERTIPVAILGDVEDELDETLTVQLSAAVNADLLDAQATGVIIDDDGLAVLSIADQTVLEGNGGAQSMAFVVTLSPASASMVTVAYATADGSATAGSDYTATSGVLTFAPGETSHVVTVDILGDHVDEGSEESLVVQLSTPANATLGDGEAVGVITDDDTARLRIEFGPRVTEGDTGVTPAVFTVTLTTPAAFPVTVEYATSDGFQGAVAGEDYQATSGTLTIPPGQTIAHIDVPVYGDVRPESDEIFRLTLSNPSPAIALETNATQATIWNDDGFQIFLPVITR